MDFNFSEEQGLLRNSLREFLKKECPTTLVREVQQGELGYSPELFRKMAELGYSGIMIPEEYDGIGGDWVDMAIFYEEAGRALLQSPHFSTTILGGQTLLAHGTTTQKRQLLPQIAQGKVTITLAMFEQGVGSNLSLLKSKAVAKGGEYVLNGEKLFVTMPDNATFIMSVFPTDDGITIFLVDGKSEGLSFIPLRTLDKQRLGIMSFQNVRVPKERVIGKSGEGAGIIQILNKAKAISCAEMIGGAEVALETAINYSKQRITFGRPIGSNQVLQHKMVDMMLAIEKAKCITYHVAWLNSEGLPSIKESAMACLQTGQACTFVTSEAIQIHGGLGAALEQDITLYYQRAKAAQLNLGRLSDLEEIIATELNLGQLSDSEEIKTAGLDL